MRNLTALFAVAVLGLLVLAGQPALADDAAPQPEKATNAAAEPVADTADAAPAEAEPEMSEEEVNALLQQLSAAFETMPGLESLAAMAEGGEAGMAAPRSYYISKMVETNYDDTVAKLKEALTAEKFAVLTEIDLQAKFKEKLQIDIPHYTIFGACGAKWAHAIWEKEFHIGALMPCNVVVAEHEDGSIEVFFKDPSQLPMATGNPEIAETVETVKASVLRVLEAL
jgi:uncharacterized protein (DUF302 family)